jgi:hypothetical protein
MSSDFEVPEPIISSPFDEPAEHWHIEEGVPPVLKPGRRPSAYFRPVGRTEWPRDRQGRPIYPRVEREPQPRRIVRLRVSGVGLVDDLRVDADGIEPGRRY